MASVLFDDERMFEHWRHAVDIAKEQDARLGAMAGVRDLFFELPVLAGAGRVDDGGQECRVVQSW